MSEDTKHRVYWGFEPIEYQGVVPRSQCWMRSKLKIKTLTTHWKTTDLFSKEQDQISLLV